MAEDAILPILIKIQDRLTAIENRLTAIENTLASFRTELDGQFQMMSGRNAAWEGLARLVAEQGKRITALERAKNDYHQERETTND